jgi:hypothetical protein
MSEVVVARRVSRFSVPRGLLTGTLAAIALVWGLYAISPGGSLLSGLKHLLNAERVPREPAGLRLHRRHANIGH